MQSNTQTRVSTWDYYLNGNYVNSTNTYQGLKVFSARNGVGKGDFTRPTSYGFSYRDSKILSSRSLRAENGQTQLWTGHDSYAQPPNRVGWSPNTTSPELLEICLGRLMEDVRGGNQVVVDLAESASTVRMLRAAGGLSVIPEILDIITGEVKRKKRYFERVVDRRDRTQKILDFASSRWLEYRYGWLPAVMSVYDAYDILHKENVGAVRTLVATAKRPIKLTYTDDYPTFIGTIPGSTKVDGVQRCRLVIEMYTPGSGIWDWTSLNPSVIAWELLPLSFVADWFVSVGDSLQYLENWLLWKSGFRSGYVTYSGKAQETTLQSGSLDNGTTRIERYFSSSSELRYKNRIVLSELPLPYAPRVRVNLGLARALDSITLTQTLFRKQVRNLGRAF